MKTTLFLFLSLGIVSAQTQSLRDLATSRGIHLAAAVTFPGNAAQYDSCLSQNFNTAGAENALKFQSTEPTQNNFNYTAGDAIVNFAIAHGMAMRGHNFIWHSQIGYAANLNVSRDSMLSVMKNHILNVGGHYKGKIYEWDVVNEGIDASQSDGLRRSVWYNNIGPDYVDSAFVYAHEADPNAGLDFNDYGAEAMNSKSNALYTLVSGLVKRGVPITGVGLQCHFSLNGFDTASIGQNMSRFEALGMNISITELDISTSNTTANLNAQGANYQALMSLCLRHPRCKTFMTWGVDDAQSWLGAAAVPLLFDASFAQKPAYDGVVTALSAATSIQTVLMEKPGVLRTMGMPGVYNMRGSLFDLQGRRLAILPLP